MRGGPGIRASGYRATHLTSGNDQEVGAGSSLPSTRPEGPCDDGFIVVVHGDAPVRPALRCRDTRITFATVPTFSGDGRVTVVYRVAELS